MFRTRFNQPLSDADIVVRLGIVGLALGTAYIHSTLGGQLFTLNALGYVVGAAAMVVPIGTVARHRWLVRIGLAAYTATTIAAWAIQGPFYSTAYLAKAIEAALIALLAIDLVRRDGRLIDGLRRFLMGVLAILVVGACSAGPSIQTNAPSIDPDALRIGAKDLKFSTSTLSAPAGEPFQIVFDNQESAPHNVAIYRDASAAERIHGSEPFGGPAVAVYEVPALVPGTYFFRRDVHPDMSGQLVSG